MINFLENSLFVDVCIVPYKRDLMKKREEFAVSLRKQNKTLKLNEKRAKIGTKARPSNVGDGNNLEGNQFGS